MSGTGRLFPDFPDSSRLWFYVFDRPLTVKERAVVEGALESLLRTWNSHGEPVKGEFAIIDEQIVILCAGPDTTISGCAIDASVRVFKELKDRDGLNALDQNRVQYRNHDGRICSIDRRQFEDFVASGTITHATIVFNNTIQILADLRNGRWETQANDSWHSQAFHLLTAG